MDAIKRSSLVDSVTSALKDYINSDSVEVGQKMPSEVALCQKYNVSRTTVREALRMLQATGYVELLPNKGAFVASKGQWLSADANNWMLAHAPQMMDALDVRMVLEPFAARMAAIKGSQTEIYAIKGLANMFDAVARQENLSAMITYDEKFHAAIAAASHNNFLIDITHLMEKTLRSYRGRTFTIDKDGSQAIEPHNLLADAIVARNPDLAEDIMRRHLENNMDIVRSYTTENK